MTDAELRAVTIAENAVAAMIAVGFGALLAIDGCGASAATRSAYSIEAAHCISNERRIVDRAGTTEEQDRADLAEERSRCDAELSRIEQEGGR